MLNKDKTSNAVKKLITEYQLKSLSNKDNSPNNAEENNAKPLPLGINKSSQNSLIKKHLQAISNARYGRPYVWQELIASLHKIPITAWENAQANKNNNDPQTLIAWSSPEALRLKEILPLIGAAAIREKNSLDSKRANRPLTVTQTMLLICYQSSPRPVAWAMQGLPVIDMLAWMYQDLIAMDLNLDGRIEDFNNNLPVYRDWLQQLPPRSGNSPLRHFRVRLAALLGTNTTNVERVINGQSEYSLPVLLQKLMERSEDKYYSRGMLRHFKEVRADFNALSEYAIRCQYGIDSVQDRRINQIKCPALYTKKEFKSLSLRVSHK